ncbi:MAG: hypothetical protein V3S03_08490 [Vicinamibacteria bacterium]
MGKRGLRWIWEGLEDAVEAIAAVADEAGTGPGHEQTVGVWVVAISVSGIAIAFGSVLR